MIELVNPTSDDRRGGLNGENVDDAVPSGRRMAAAVGAGVVAQYAWTAFALSQVDAPLIQLCSGSSCEPYSPGDNLLMLSIPTIGPLMSVAIAALFGFSLRRLDNWLRFLLGVPILAIFLLITVYLTVATI